MSSTRIVFYGTPAIAVASLKRLCEEGFNIITVVTSPDKPAGRGLQITVSPVKEYALMQGIPVLQPESLRDPEFLDALKILNPDLQIVVAFRMMPKEVFQLPPMGTFNLHASLLPQYRGAAPVNRAIMNGEKETGVTTFFLEEKMDTGKIILFERVGIGDFETAGELLARLADIGAGLVTRSVRAIENGEIRPIAQDELIRPGEMIKPAPKFSREDARINLEKNYIELFNLIRGMSPVPGAFIDLIPENGKEISIKVLRARPEQIPGNGILTDLKRYLKLPARDGYLDLIEVQPAGKKVMSIDHFLNGFARYFTYNPY
jgi:methionyl-tRNA formyltransferase